MLNESTTMPEKMYGVAGIWLQAFLTVDTDGMVSCTLQPLYHQGENPSGW
jgi:hypothetical protein